MLILQVVAIEKSVVAIEKGAFESPSTTVGQLFIL